MDRPPGDNILPQARRYPLLKGERISRVWAGWMSMRLFPPAAAQGEQGEGRQAEGGSGGLRYDLPYTRGLAK